MMIQLGLSRYQIMTKTKRRTIPKNKNRKTDKYLGYLFTKQQFFLQNWFDEVEDFKRENINPFKWVAVDFLESFLNTWSTILAKSCFTLSVFRDIPSPVTGHYTQVKHLFCPRKIEKFAHPFLLWQPFSNSIFLPNPDSVCLIRQIWIFNEQIWIIN